MPTASSPTELDRWLATRVRDTADRELAVAHFGVALLADDKVNADDVEKLTRWLPEGMAFTGTAPSQPKKKARKAA